MATEIIHRAKDLRDYKLGEPRYWLFGSDSIEIPQPAEEALSGCLANAHHLVRSELDHVQASITEEIADSLLVYSARLATLAVRTCQSKYILLGVTALCLDKDLVDPRDVLAPLCLLVDAAKRTRTTKGIDFRSLSSIATSERREMIHEYVTNRFDSVSPEVMGFEPVGTGRVFLYKSK